MEEKKLEEEEAKLQRMKEDALRQKQSQHEELNRLREARKKTIQGFEAERHKYGADLQAKKEEQAREAKNLDDIIEKRQNKKQLWELEHKSE